MPAKKVKDQQANRLVNAVLKELGQDKDKKIAKTFSVSESNYIRLAEWCEINNEKPSKVVDMLLKIFLENNNT